MITLSDSKNMKNNNSIKNFKNKFVEQKSFIARWNDKADSYAGKKNDLASTFDEFVTRFIVYNVLYNLCAEKLIYGKKVGDKKKATEAVFDVLQRKSAHLLSVMAPDIEKLNNIISENGYIIDTDGPANNNVMLKKMSSSNTDEKIKSVLNCLYKLRCNLIHGDKEYMEEQQPLLATANNCLKILNEEICMVLGERLYVFCKTIKIK